MYEGLHGRIARLAGEGGLLRAGLKGVEKECLRADAAGEIAATPHPPAASHISCGVGEAD